nr:TPA_asm: hypothetical protein [Pimephales minnow adintovirus]
MGGLCSTEFTEGNMSYMTMDALSSPKTPEIDLSSMMMDNLAMAPKKSVARIGLTSFLHENTEWVKDEFKMCSKRVFGYKFHKPSRFVMLYTVDSGEEFRTAQDECVAFPEKDWSLFYKFVWKDLNDGGEEPLYTAEWDGITPDFRYRVVGDHTRKNPDDFVYIFCCKDKTKLSNMKSGVIDPNEHHDLYDLQFMFNWRDLDLLNSVFSHIDKMFKWCDMLDGYNKVKVQLFHPERCPRSSSFTRPSAPIHYGHPKSLLSDPRKRLYKPWKK